MLMWNDALPMPPLKEKRFLERETRQANTTASIALTDKPRCMNLIRKREKRRCLVERK